jgi:sodium-dependent phosphate cotransporter
MASGYLEWLSSAIVQNMGNSSNGFDSSSLDFMDAIKKPVTLKIIDIDSGLMQKYANPNYNRTGNETFLRQTCTKTYSNKTTYQEPCRYLFNSDLFDDWSETTIGIVVLVLSLAVVIGCLLMISKLLGALFQGATAKIVQKVLNANQEGIMGELIGYLSILVKA